MNDCTGKEIKVGDRIIYFRANSGNEYFWPAIVTKINKRSVGVISGREKRDWKAGTYTSTFSASNHRLKRNGSQIFVMDEFPDRPGWFNKTVKAMAKFAIESKDIDDKIRESCIYDLAS